ncbi:unnamed protein product [Diatraea saccharalis]|uniref:FP protein C-terminal domain-containing protein n=1 Tax=Diatraea saccharalis TaxID=40085 RepID=A0A9N9WGW3_9NEOP|nr:unnamed protein product [Diatraea saccharalis]
MPLKRTPPSIHLSESEPNQSSAPDTENESSNNMNSRPRARKRQHGDELTTFMVEIRGSMETLKTQQDILQDSVNDIQKQNNDIRESMEFISRHYEEIKDRLTRMESERKVHLAYIQSLETKVETLARVQKQATVEIRNIPVKKGESKTDLLNIVKKIGDAVSVKVEENHIRDVFRMNTKKGDRPVLVDFSTVILRDKILASVKDYNRKNKENKLHTGQLEMVSQVQPIFIGESLTQAARRICFLARELGKKNGYAYCWTAHGRVFLRKKEGSPARLISRETDLDHQQSNPDI